MMQRYFAINKEQDKIILEPSDIHHITNVMRMNDGDEIEVVFDSKLYLCCIVNVKFDIQISVKKELKFEEKNLEIVLIIPILKEQKMDYILQKSTELGVTKIVPITTLSNPCKSFFVYILVYPPSIINLLTSSLWS